MSDLDPFPVKRRSTAPLVIVSLVVIAGFLFATSRLYVFKPYKVPSGAMMPTIPIGSHCYARGYDTKPVRGGLFVFRYPEHRDQDFVKRAIALGGDVVAVKQKKVSINGWPIPRCVVGKWEYSDDQQLRHPTELSVEFLGDATYLVAEQTDFTMIPDFGPYTVKPGEFFVLGDDRDNSHDSRMWFGGAGGGVPNGDSLGRVRTFDEAKLPAGAENLAAAFQACLAKRPAQTNPPAPGADDVKRG